MAACLLGILIVYSQTAAFAWDEGYHILAAQLIARGKRPYLDFFFPQTPLNAYWNAAGMRLFGQTWRAVHALSAVVTAGTILLAADFIYTRFPVAAWRMPGAVAAALLIGLQANFIEYTTTAQPYALCLFLLVAAFRMSVLAVQSKSPAIAMAAGLLASAALACSLLVSLAPAVLLFWILRLSPAGRRLRSLAAFLAGAVVPFVPVLWLFARAPRQVFFNLFQYHLFYRRANWEDATPHDWKVLTSWLISPQALLLGLLGAVGFWYYRRRPEFSLCGWLALAIGAELCATHPTFEWYYVLIIPFLGILGVAGLQAATQERRDESRLIVDTPVGRSPWTAPDAPVRPLLGAVRPDRGVGSRARAPAPHKAVAVVLVVVALGSARSLYKDRHDFSWRDLEPVARKVEEVTPRGAPLWADEHVYFLTGRPPIEGTEVSYAEVIELPAALAASLHIVPLDDLRRRAADGGFSTVSTCEEKEQYEALDLPRSFRHSAAVGTCHVFWDPLLR